MKDGLELVPALVKGKSARPSHLHLFKSGRAFKSCPALGGTTTLDEGSSFKQKRSLTAVKKFFLSTTATDRHVTSIA